MSKHVLERKLGLVDLVFFGIGAIMGTGIFVIPAIASEIAGFSAVWVWIVLAILSIIMALCFAELASIHPHAGGPYQFVKEAFGNYIGFLSGWTAWLISWVTIASLAIAVSYYMAYFFNMRGYVGAIISISVLVLVTALNYHGLQWGTKAQYFLTSVSILVLWMFITWGIYFIRVEHFTQNMLAGGVGVSAMLLAAVFVIEPFIGWETITYFAEDAKKPKRDIPRAIVYSSIFVSVFYCAVIFVALGILRAYHIQGSPYPLAEVAKVFLGLRGAGIIAAGAIVVLLGCLNSWVVSTARLPFAIARDGFFPKSLHNLHHKHNTPHVALILQLLFASVAVVVTNFEGIIYMLVSLAMIFYIMIFLSIPIHRRRVKNIPFKTPFGLLLPCVAIGIAIVILSQIDLSYLVFSSLMILSGSVIYSYMKVWGK